MTYKLYIGDRTFSSWSMRGWLMLEKFGLPYKTTLVGLYAGTYRDELAPLAPARTVPAMRMPSGGILTDSLAMAETLAECHPEIPMYPAEPKARALARSITCEMHSGFAALRDACPQMLAHAWDSFPVSPSLRADLDRIELLWSMARELAVSDGPWLFGDYTLADVFYVPIAGRIATYGLDVGPAAQSYVTTAISDQAFRRWRAMGLARPLDPMPYRQELAETVWPGPKVMTANPVDSGTPENDLCPYSELPVTHYAQIEDRIFGFCNPFCRDKTVADPAAWPSFMAIFNR